MENILLRYITLLAILTYPLWALAQNSSHEDAARELLIASDSDQMIDMVYDSVLPQLEAMFDQLGVTEAQRPIFDRFFEQMVNVMKEEMSWEKLEPLMVATYIEVYTEQELLELAEFYRSPIGRKFISGMPQVMKIYTTRSQSLTQGMYSRIFELAEEMKSELAKSED
ncbi:MAG: DUF2059 domain-containing protein [Woeseiaceae bacterium]